MEPVVDEAAELDNNVPKMFCQLDNHLGKNFFYFSYVSEIDSYVTSRFL